MRWSSVAVSLAVALIGLMASVPMGRLVLDTTAQVATPPAETDNVVIQGEQVDCGPADRTPAGATPEVTTWATEAGEAVVSCGADGIEVTCGLTPAGVTPEVITVETEAGAGSFSCGVVSNEPSGAAVAALLFAPGLTLPSPASLMVRRDTLAPRAVWRVVSDDPTLTLIAVEAGALTVCAAAPVDVAWDGWGQEVMPADTPVVLGPGDLALVPPDAGGELRNDGEEPVVALLTIIAPEAGSELVTEDPRRVLVAGCG